MKSCYFSPALLPLQQFTVSGYLNIQSHFDIEEVLVLPKVASHLVLQVADLILQPAYIVLIVANFTAKLVLHVTHLPQQSFILTKQSTYGVVLKDNVICITIKVNIGK